MFQYSRLESFTLFLLLGNFGITEKRNDHIQSTGDLSDVLARNVDHQPLHLIDKGSEWCQNSNDVS